jgi:hypothetical protein
MSSHRSQHKGRIASGLIIRGANEKQSFNLPPMYENEFIPDTKQEVATPEIVAKLDTICNLAEHFVSLDRDADVNILIGRDSGVLMNTQTIGNTNPIVHKTPLGWAVVGSVCPIATNTECAREFITVSTSLDHDHYSASLVFSKKENVFEERSDDNIEGLSVDDCKFCEIMDNNMAVNSEGFIEMPLPLRHEEKQMPDNRRAVYNRQYNTLRRLKHDSGKLHQCISFMQNIIDEKHVELLSHDEQIGPEGKTWYIPVFPVLHPKKKKFDWCSTARLPMEGQASIPLYYKDQIKITN